MNESKPYYAILDEMRRSYHMTVKQICDYTGFSERTYQRIQQGKASPTVASFCRWWAYFHISPNFAGGNRMMLSTNFPITSFINDILEHLRQDVTIAQPELMRAKLTEYSQRYMQDDFQILLKLLDLRVAATEEEQLKLAKVVIAQLKRRHFWTDFETQCFLVVEPHLGWTVVSHCMMRYLAHLEPKGQVIPQLHFRNWHELLLLGYIRAAAQTRIYENVAQALTWGREIGAETFEGSVDRQIIYALIGQLLPLFQSASLDNTAIGRVFQPVYRAASEIRGGAPPDYAPQTVTTGPRGECPLPSRSASSPSTCAVSNPVS